MLYHKCQPSVVLRSPAKTPPPEFAQVTVPSFTIGVIINVSVSLIPYFGTGVTLIMPLATIKEATGPVSTAIAAGILFFPASQPFVVLVFLMQRSIASL